jgi:hypothetical protein
VIIRLAVRSLATRPLRSAVLATGFGLGIGVMASLLGVGEVILEQARSPALAGGGDLVVAGSVGGVDNARFVMANVIGADQVRQRTTAVSPSRTGSLYLMAKSGEAIPVSVRGGIPSRQKAVGQREVAAQTAWTDDPGDAAWTRPSQDDILRAIDRFHPIPRGTAQRSWSEWLYFNGRTTDGRLRFYLTFLVGGPSTPLRAGPSTSLRASPSTSLGAGSEGGTRPALVRLQLDRDGRSTNYSAAAMIDARELLERAPDLDVAGNHVRVDGSRYRIDLALAKDSNSSEKTPAVTGELILDAPPGRSLPPGTIHGLDGWMSGYVVPVLAGALHGTLIVDGAPLPLEGATGYHDHNWGFWSGVRWQWGQVADRDLSIVWGRVFPPSSVADPDRIPGVLAVLGPDGLIAFSTNVAIVEEGTSGDVPRSITVQATGHSVDLTATFTPAERVRSRLSALGISDGAAPMDFLQLGGDYRVAGRAGNRALAFTARGAAETFRPALDAGRR